MTDALRYDGVSFTYPEASRPALRDVTARLDEGTFALVAGATGAGKSTLLRAANGLVPHFTGGTFEQAEDGAWTAGVLFEGDRDVAVDPGVPTARGI